MVGESGGSAARKAAELRADGKRSAGAWAAGAEGERRVAEALTQLPSDWLVLHDRLLMPGLAESNLDHLLVGPAGVILIDAKNWAGQIGEWDDSVFQHKWRSDGKRVHRPVDREFAGVAGMATEVARRINHRVFAVICLAGRSADQFGEPRLVKNVWVVPVNRLVEWLNARPPVEIEDCDRLGVLVRTEFPSTTTDAELLLAMGRDLKAHQVQLGRDSLRRVMAPRFRVAPTAPPGRTGKATVPRRRRRSSRLRPLIGLLPIVLLLVGLQTGIVSSILQAAIVKGTDASGSTTQSVGSTGGAGAVAPPATAAKPALLSCSSLDVSRLKYVKNRKLVAREQVGGCQWSLVSGKGSSQKSIKVLRIKEDTGRFGLSPLIKRSRDNKTPEIYRGYSASGRNMWVWVAAGVRIKGTGKTVKATRHTEVSVEYQALGLTRKQGESLALSISRTVSTIPKKAASSS